MGGVGLRRGRTNAKQYIPVILLISGGCFTADRQNRRLLLYAEMKLPGEAWLEFKIIKKEGENSFSRLLLSVLKDLLGRLYWYSVLPFHYFVFDGMAENIAKYN